MDVAPLSPGGFLQLGGSSDLSAAQRYNWPNGNIDTFGTPVTGTVNFTTALTFTGDRSVDWTIWVGNGYGASGTSGTWTGTLTLHGINSTPLGATPVPEVSTLGAGGLLGAGAFWALRRRQRIQQSGNA